MVQMRIQLNFTLRIKKYFINFLFFSEYKWAIQGSETENRIIVDLHNKINLDEIYDFNGFYNLISKSDKYEQYREILEQGIKV